jgi:RecB family exonuclease
LILEDGEDRVQLRGFIDRIDRREDGRIRIIDYKLGGPYSFAPRAFDEGKKLQLPLYALAAEVALALGEVADGFYWHFRQVEKSPFQLAKAEGGVNGAMETAVAHTWDVVRRVRRGEFKPQPPAEGCPPYCPAAGFCWHYTPKSW